VRWITYFGPYGGLLIVAFVLTIAYYLYSFRLYPELHSQVFKILMESVKKDLRLFPLLLDPVVFYLGVALAVFGAFFFVYSAVKFIKGGRSVRQADLFADRRTAVFTSSSEELREALGEDYEAVKPMVLRYKDLFLKALELFKDLPASKGYHHGEKFGLFRHSVSVAYRLYKEADRIAEICGLDKETAQKVAVVLGLFHDAGKVFKGVPFRFQNALAVLLLGRLEIDLPPELLSRIAYAIVIQHTEYASLDPEPLLKVLRSLDALDTQEDIEKKQKECMMEFLSSLKQRVESMSGEWNNKKFFKVIYNPRAKELLINMRIFDEVYEFVSKRCSIVKGDLLALLIKEGYVKPVGDGGFASFEIKGIGKFPAILFDAEKFPVNAPTITHIPEYIPAHIKGEREEFLSVLSEIVAELGDKIHQSDSPIVYYKDKEEEWLILKSQALELFEEKGKKYANLSDVGDRTGFIPEKVTLRSIKVNTKVIKIPAELISVEVGKGTD